MSRENVNRVLEHIGTMAGLAGLELGAAKGEIRIVGAMLDVATGEVRRY